MGKETKFGLLVGVAFIVLFGVILGGRVGSAAGDHAPLPVGDSGGHQVLVDTILGSDDPLESDRRLLAMDEPAADAGTGDAEDAGTPAREDAAPAASDAEPAPTGRLAMAPARVETPMPMPGGTETLHPQDDPAEAVSPEPAPEPEPASPPAPQRPVHIVAKGETLTTIARKYYGADGARLWRRIWEANKDRLADPHRLGLGQSLVIPGLPAEPSSAETRTADASDASGAGTPAESADDAEEASVTLDDLARRFKVRLDDGEVTPDPSAPSPTYTVQKGDTFYSIAQKVYGDPSLTGKLVRKNRDRVPDARRLRVGQTILLLEGVQSAGATEAAEERVAQVASR